MWNQRLEDCFIGKLSHCTSLKSPNLLRWFPAPWGCVSKHWSPLLSILAAVYQNECEEVIVRVCYAINNGFAVLSMSHSVTGAETAVDRRLNCSARQTPGLSVKFGNHLMTCIGTCDIKDYWCWQACILIRSLLWVGFFSWKKIRTDLCKSFTILSLFWSL